MGNHYLNIRAGVSAFCGESNGSVAGEAWSLWADAMGTMYWKKHNGSDSRAAPLDFIVFVNPGAYYRKTVNQYFPACCEGKTIPFNVLHFSGQRNTNALINYELVGADRRPAPG